MVEWEEVRRQVAIAGQVTNAQTGRALGGVQVEITAAPAAFTDWLAIRALQYGGRWAALTERPDRTRTARDGHFHFLDLPDGEYTLTASLPEAGKRYGKAQVEVRVSRDADGNVSLGTADAALPPTTLQGRITGPGLDEDGDGPVVMAAVRVKGSGERTFSDAEGRYLLPGLEVGERTVLVSARGYEPVEQTVRLNQAGAVQTLDFTLVPATP